MKIQPIDITLKNGLEVTIREATINDIQNLINAAKSYLRTSEYLCSYEDEFNPTEDEEIAWIKSHEYENSLLLVATYNNQILATFNSTGFQNEKMKHISALGISIREEWRGVGLGKFLFEVLVKWANSNPAVEKLILEVFSENKHAISLYKSFGFEIEGVRKNYFKEKSGKYVDNVLMSLDVK